MLTPEQMDLDLPDPPDVGEALAEALADARTMTDLLAREGDGPPREQRRALTDAAILLAQGALMRLIAQMRHMDPLSAARTLPPIVRALVDLGRLETARAQIAAGLDAMADRVSGEGGTVSVERLREIVREVYGL
jgi:hypothetical protein